MTRSFRSLIERQIQKARAKGELDGLKGEGQPLPNRPEDRATDPGLAIGMGIMARAGVIPEEFELKRQLDEARAEYTGLTDPDERKSAMARIADLEMRYNLARDSRKSFFR